ncbi:Golgi integral membrane protein 4-like [Heptranchias perlo]|uniref:Golgi integral membrane protein 4-like n=1 Tax=Heptranchias perlo TaxID=212740 RepID=UPI00355984C5
MGNGMCSRRQKGLLQTGFCALLVLCFGLGFYTYTHLKENVRSAEMLAQKYKQQQESVSAQLQVVYEHRSRLERSLQKERGEHKKTKEDFLVYKLEAQESLNKEKQDAMNRYGALSSQHKILKNQHDEIKKQLLDLQLQHNSLRLEHRKAAETHNQRYLQLHQQKELEISSLQDNVFKLKHESKQLRKAHQDIHLQLTEAQAQVEEFRQLKEALRGMPSFKKPGLNPVILQEQNQALQEHPRGPGSSQSQPTAEQKEQQPLAGVMGVGERALNPQSNGEQAMKEAPAKARPKDPLQERPALRNVPVWDSNKPLRPQEEGANRVLRFTRTVNSLQPDSPDMKAMADGMDQTHGVTVEHDHIPLDGDAANEKQGPFVSNELKSESQTISHQTKMKRWDEIINDVNTDTDFKLHSQMEQRRNAFVQNNRELQTVPAQTTRRHWRPGHGNATGGAANKEGDEVMDEYQDDQEAENEDHGGEMDDDHEDPDLIHQDANEDAGIPDDEGNQEEDY